MIECEHEWCDFAVPSGMGHLFETHDDRHETLVDFVMLGTKPYTTDHDRDEAALAVRYYVEEHGWPL